MGKRQLVDPCVPRINPFVLFFLSMIPIPPIVLRDSTDYYPTHLKVIVSSSSKYTNVLSLRTPEKMSDMNPLSSSSDKFSINSSRIILCRLFASCVSTLWQFLSSLLFLACKSHLFQNRHLAITLSIGQHHFLMHK